MIQIAVTLLARGMAFVALILCPAFFVLLTVVIFGHAIRNGGQARFGMAVSLGLEGTAAYVRLARRLLPI